MISRNVFSDFSDKNGCEGGGGAARRCVRDAASPAHAHAPAPAPPAPSAPPPSASSASSTHAVKSERLSPHDSTASRSRSVTPSTSSYPGTPPERCSPHAPLVHAHQLPRNCSDIIRSLAAKYNAPPSNEYFHRANGLGIDRSSTLPPAINSNRTSYCGAFSKLMRRRYGTPQAQTLTPAMDVRLAKMLWAVFHIDAGIRLRRKRSKATVTTEHSPLDLSAAGESAAKRARLSASPSTRSDGDERDRVSNEDRSEARECLCAEARKRLSAWSVDEVCDFVSSIDICAEYAPLEVKKSKLFTVTNKFTETTENWLFTLAQRYLFQYFINRGT
ncbi:unnamed protein product [Euphydryas editha]|uniref:Uncharacterized protein n=1 Tax=Euphydryas editha TaxID=104508 RepID=A0AAU9U832_EUPED|nr:unnamed protein product [Euphydryas editha]